MVRRNHQTIKILHLIFCCVIKISCLLWTSWDQSFLQTFMENFPRPLSVRQTKKENKRTSQVQYINTSLSQEKSTFLHGENGNRSIPYSAGVLSRKSVIRESGNKILGCAILCQFIMREDSCADYLKPIFSKIHNQIPSSSGNLLQLFVSTRYKSNSY